MIRFAKYVVIAAVIPAVSSSFGWAADVTSTYSLGAANWTTAAWINVPAMGGFPNNGNGGVATFDAIYNGFGTLTLDQDITIQKFTLINSTLSGSFTLTTNDLLHATSTTMSGSGITNANGGLTIDGSENDLVTRTLNNGGFASFTGGAGVGYFYMYDGATFNNSGTFDSGWAANFNNTFLPFSGAPGTFNNSGTFTRSVGSGTTTISLPFNNSNIVTVQAGTLLLNGGGTQSGSFQVASGATLNIGGVNTTLASGASLAGPGTTIISGTVSVTGPAVTYSGGGNLKLTGTLTGAGTLTATAPMEWSSGMMSGGGVTNANGGLTIDGTENDLITRTLNNGGAASFTGGAGVGYFYIYEGATFNNSGTFDTGWTGSGNNNILPFSGAPGTFNNSGTFTRSVGSGTTTVSLPFNNSNIVTVQAGKLVLSGEGKETGSFQVASGATLNSAGSGMVFYPGASLSGPGTTTITGTVNITIPGPAVTYSGGGNLQLTGTVTGPGTLTTTAPMEWSSGMMSGSGITNANGGITIDGTEADLVTRTLNNGGAASFTGGASVGYFYMYDGATFNNSGTFDSGWAGSANNNILPYTGAPGTVNNSGTFARSIGSGTTSIQVPFANNGAVNVSAGKLEFDSGFSLGNNSSLSVSGGTLKFVVDTVGNPSVGSGVTATISGSGVLELAGSVSVLGVASPVADRVAITNTSSAAAGLLVSAGNHQVGAISGTGNVLVNAGTSLTANSIIAGALSIGGQSGNPGKVTIDASNSSGQSLDSGLALVGNADFASSSPGGGFSGSDATGSSVGPPLDAGPELDAGPAPDAFPVPEPSAILIFVLALLGLPPLVGRRRLR